MASANVELVRSIFAAWERGDFSSVEWAHPEMEFVMVDGPTPGRWIGPGGMIAASRDFLSAWQAWRMEADEYRELDDERVLVLVHYAGSGKTSGLDLGQVRTEGAAVFVVRDGLVTRLVRWFDRERALAELGLAPECVSQENVEIVRALAEAFRRRDHERPFDLYAADVEWDASLHPAPDMRGVYRGHEGVRTFWRRWLSPWRDLEFEFDLRDAGDDVVMLVRNQRQWGRHSGIVTEVPPYALVFTFRDGKVARIRFVPDHQSALRAVGLHE